MEGTETGDDNNKNTMGSNENGMRSNNRRMKSKSICIRQTCTGPEQSQQKTRIIFETNEMGSTVAIAVD